MKIFVTGATGTVGGAVVGDLLKRGASVRALSRKQPEPGKLPQGLEIALGDLTDPPSVLKALDGIDKMFLLIGNVADEFTQGVTAYGLARRGGVKHITYLSVMQADRFLDVPHFAGKAAIEHTIKNYDVPFTILRPGYFMQNDARLGWPVATGTPATADLLESKTAPSANATSCAD
jgi:uncharacterized protein YbjT (DUF2867 family)